MALLKPNLAAIKAAAAAEAELLLPTYYPCREDISNGTPTDLVSRADGARLAGTVSVNDIIPGSTSPAIWAYYPTLTALASLTFIIGIAAAYLGAWVPLSSIADAWTAGSGVMGSIGYALKITVVGWMLWGALPAAGVAAQMYYWYLILSEQEPSRDFYRVWSIATAIIVLGCVALPFVGPLGCAFTSLLSIVGFRIYVASLEKSRDDILRDVTNDTRTATVLKGRQAQEEARKVQAANSLKDKTNLIPIGRTNSTLRKDGDLLTGDPGSMLCLTVKDLEESHILVKGMSGSGKTTRFIRPFVRWVASATWDRNRSKGTWGIAVFDGAKNLAEDLRDILDHVVTPDTYKINMLAGVPVEIASLTMLKMRASGPDDGGWQGKTEVLCRHALRMMEVINQLKDKHGNKAFPDIHYSWTCADDWVKNPELRKVVIAKLFDEYSDAFEAAYLRKT